MKVKISSLKLNHNLFPRVRLDEDNIARMIEALKAGKTLPPVVADKKTKIVVDGFHRIEAHKSLYGEGTEIAVIYKEYGGIKEIFLDAAEINNSQGKPLTPEDLLRCQSLAKSMKIKPEFLASALSVTVESISSPATLRAHCSNNERDPVEKKEKPHEDNKKKLYDEKKRKRTDRQIFHIRQVMSFLESDNYDFDNPLLMESLTRLMKILNGLL